MAEKKDTNNPMRLGLGSPDCNFRNLHLQNEKTSFEMMLQHPEFILRLWRHESFKAYGPLSVNANLGFHT